jgi:hypothetical protein
MLPPPKKHFQNVKKFRTNIFILGMKDKSCILLEMSLFNTDFSIQIILFVHNFVVMRILILREYDVI